MKTTADDLGLIYGLWLARYRDVLGSSILEVARDQPHYC